MRGQGRDSGRAALSDGWRCRRQPGGCGPGGLSSGARPEGRQGHGRGRELSQRQGPMSTEKGTRVKTYENSFSGTVETKLSAGSTQKISLQNPYGLGFSQKFHLTKYVNENIRAETAVPVLEANSRRKHLPVLRVYCERTYTFHDNETILLTM